MTPGQSSNHTVAAAIDGCNTESDIVRGQATDSEFLDQLISSNLLKSTMRRILTTRGNMTNMDRYFRMAVKHWTEFQPELVEELKADGQLEKQIQLAVDQTHREISQLMARGVKLHEAEEIVLPRYILPPPPREDDWDDLMTDEDRQRLRDQSGHYRDVERAKSL